MTEYEELLSTEDWYIKRGSVVKRDKHSCQNCRNESLQDFSYSIGIRANVSLSHVSYILTNPKELKVGEIKVV